MCQGTFAGSTSDRKGAILVNHLGICDVQGERRQPLGVVALGAPPNPPILQALENALPGIDLVSGMFAMHSMYGLARFPYT